MNGRNRAPWHRAVVAAAALAPAVAAPDGAAPDDFDAGLAAYLEADDVTAARRWRECANAGEAACQYGLAVLHEEGRGVAHDADAALVWLRRAARQGHVEAQVKLGFVYATGGDGVDQDPVEAWAWFARAAAGGDPRAAKYRDRVGALLTEEELERATRLSDERSIRYHLQE